MDNQHEIESEAEIEEDVSSAQMPRTSINYAVGIRSKNDKKQAQGAKCKLSLLSNSIVAKLEKNPYNSKEVEQKQQEGHGGQKLKQMEQVKEEEKVEHVIELTKEKEGELEQWKKDSKYCNILVEDTKYQVLNFIAGRGLGKL